MGFSENTWKAGLERLLLGYAMPGFEEHMFEGVLPYDQIEGNEASVLGRFLSFADGLFTRVTSLDRPKTLSDWANALTDLLKGFFVADENTENQMHLIRRMLRDVGETQEMSGFDEKVDISVIKSYVRKNIKREGMSKIVKKVEKTIPPRTTLPRPLWSYLFPGVTVTS